MARQETFSTLEEYESALADLRIEVARADREKHFKGGYTHYDWIKLYQSYTRTLNNYNALKTRVSILRQSITLAYPDDFVISELTSGAGDPLSLAYGRTQLGGNIIRGNDPDEDTSIKLIVGNCLGEIDGRSDSSGNTIEYLATFVNEIIWDDYIEDHQKWSYSGSNSQSGITNVFDGSGSVAFNYRGVAVSEYEFIKSEELSSIDDIAVIGRFKKCLEIGEDLGGTRSWTRNPAQILWDWYIDIEGLTSSYLSEDDFIALEIYCSTIPANAESVALLPPGPCKNTVIATSEYVDSNDFNYAFYAFDQLLSNTGDYSGQGWLSEEGNASEQVISIDLGTQYAVDSLDISNYHETGLNTEIGIYEFSVWATNSYSAFTRTDYDDFSDCVMISGTSFYATEHIFEDEADFQTFSWENSTPYRYYKLRIADNYGNLNYIGLRRCILYGKTQRYTFDYVFNEDSTINDSKKVLFQSFNGSILNSQGKLKPVWDGGEESDGAGGLQTKTVKHAFTIDNIVKDSFSWGKNQAPNVIKVNFLDSAQNYSKEVVELRDEVDIEIKGEIEHEVNCWYITDLDVATRRCRFLMEKAKYTDFNCNFTAFPDACDLELLDRVTVTYPLAGFDSKDFLVIGKTEDVFGNPKFELEAYYSGLYHDLGFEKQQSYAVRLPNVYAPPVSVTNLVLTQDNYFDSSSGNWIGKLILTYDPPTSSNFYGLKLNVQVGDNDFEEYGVDLTRGSGYEIVSTKVNFYPGAGVTVAAYSISTLGTESKVSSQVTELIEFSSLKSAINSLPDEGGTIILPKGVYDFEGITIPNKDITIRGVTRGGVTINLTTGVTRHFAFYEYSSRFNISDLNIISSSTKGCSHTLSSGATSNIFFCRGTGSLNGNITLENIKFTGVSAVYTETINTDVSAYINNDMFFYSYTTNSSSITVNNCEFYYAGRLYFRYGDSLNIENNKFYYSTYIATRIYSNYNSYVNNNYYYNCLSYGIYYSGNSETKININKNNFLVSGVSAEHSNLSFIAIYNSSFYSSPIITNNQIYITGCTLQSFSGIINYGSSGLISNNDFNLSSFSKNDDIKVIELSWNSSNSIINGNKIIAKMRETNRSIYCYGIYVNGAFTAVCRNNNINSNNINLTNNNNPYDIGIRLDTYAYYSYGDGNITYNVNLSVSDTGLGNNVTAQDV